MTRDMHCSQQNQKYNILLLITDGVINDLQQTIKLKDVHHVELTPMYKDSKQKQVFNKDNKYNSKKLTEAFCGL